MPWYCQVPYGVLMIGGLALISALIASGWWHVFTGRAMVGVPQLFIATLMFVYITMITGNLWACRSPYSPWNLQKSQQQ